MENTATIPAQAKEVCNRSVTYQTALARKPKELIHLLRSKTDLDQVEIIFWHLG